MAWSLPRGVVTVMRRVRIQDAYATPAALGCSALEVAPWFVHLWCSIHIEGDTTQVTQKAVN